MKGLKINANGLVGAYDLHEENYTYTFEAMAAAINCDTIDIVHAINLPDPYCMVVDDEGLLKNEPLVNPIASYLYGFLTHGQPICGDVIIMKDKHTPDGIETVGLTKDDLSVVSGLLFNPDTFEDVKRTIEGLKELIAGGDDNA